MVERQSERAVHHLVIDALAIRAHRVMRGVTLRHPHLAAQRHNRTTRHLRFGDTVTRHIMRETVGIAIATVIKLRFLFRTFQNMLPRTAVPVPASGLDSGETGSSDPNRPSKIANAIIKTPHTSRNRGPTAFHHSRAALRRHPYARTAPTRAYADVAHVLNQSRYA